MAAHAASLGDPPGPQEPRITSPPPHLPPLRAWAVATLTAVAGAVGLLGPNLARMGQAAMGARESDALKHVWSQWWVWHRLQTDGALPWETRLLNHPTGGAFFSLDLANALLGGPLRLLAGPVLVYNVLHVVHVVLAFLAAWLLARAVTGRDGPALAAGAAFAWSPWAVSFAMASGVSETAFLWPLPLVALCALRTVEQPGWAAPVAGSALLVLQAVACTSYALVAGIGLLALLGTWLAGRPWQRPGFRPALGRMALVAGLVLAAAAPLTLAVSGTLAGGVYERPLSLFGAFDPRTLPELQQLSVAQWLTPGRGAVRVHEGADRLYVTGYLRWTLLALAAAGGRRAWGWIALAAVFLALSLGPELTVDLDRSWPGWSNPVFLTAWWTVPLFSLAMHGVDRFIMGASLALGVAAAVGLARWRSPWVGVAASLALWGETVALSPAPWPIPQQPAAPTAVADALVGGPGAVLDLPLFDPQTGRLRGQLLLDQMVHQRPLPVRFEGRGAQALAPPVRDQPFVRALHGRLAGQPGAAPCSEAAGLARLGFGDVVLHDTPGVDGSAAAELLTRCLGPGEAVGTARRWRVTP